MAIKEVIFMNQPDVRKAFELIGKITAAQYGCQVKLVKLERKDGTPSVSLRKQK